MSLDPRQPSRKTRLIELALLFLKLGTTAFGGPAAHMALMEDEVVRRREWLTREEFLDLLGATQLIPGPNSTELAIHIGHRRAGFAGLLVAGACFILPATILVTVIAWSYTQLGKLPQLEGLLYGIKPVMLAVILQALWGLGRTAMKTKLLGGLGVAAALANLAGVHELVSLFVAGAFMASMASVQQRRSSTQHLPLMAMMPWLPLNAAVASQAAAPFGLGKMFLFFLKVGSVLFGSGYVLLAFLRADLVDRWQWLTEAQLLDAITVGQITPGPVFTTATFIGYLLGGTAGAAIATLGIFLPAFFFVAISGPLVPRLRRSRVASGFLDGVNVASLALMAVVTGQLGRVAVIDVPTLALALVSIFLLMHRRVNSAWLILTGAAVGIAAKLL